MTLTRRLWALLALLAFILVAGCGSTSGVSAPVLPETNVASGDSGLYGIDPGSYSVKIVDMLVLRDDVRGRDLQTRITYPGEGSDFPVIMWSHGLGGTKDAYQPIVQHWVSHGYVCIQMNHTDSRQLTKSPETNDWKNRPGDISFVIDSLNYIEKEITVLKERMDITTIGVGGHSFGAHTAQLVGGATTRRLLAGQQQSYADDRPAAFLMISPQGTGGLLDEDSWNGFTRPAMVITGSNDSSPISGKPYTWRLELFEYMPPGDKYLVFIEEAYHGFGGITGNRIWAGSGPENPRHVEYVKSTTIAFWDAYLKNDERAFAYLNSDSLALETQGEARLTQKN